MLAVKNRKRATTSLSSSALAFGGSRPSAQPGIIWAVGLAVVAVVVFNVHGWLVLGRTSAVLEAELGKRLEAVATTLSLALAGRTDEPAQAFLAEALAENSLFNIYVINEKNEYLVNLRNPELVGSTDPVLDLDMPEILSAFSGIPVQSRLYRAGRYFLKSAYAPMRDSSGNICGVLGAEADAEFYSVLAKFRRSMFVINGLSLVAVVAVILASASLVRHALRVEQAASRANLLALMGQMSAGVAHEIKNPLAIIRAAAERLKKRYAPDGKDPVFDYITEETDRLANVVSNYLGIGARGPGPAGPVKIATVLAEVIRDLGPEAQKHGVMLTLTPELRAEHAELTVAAAQSELRQVFLNLVLNGIQAQPAGGRVELSLDAEPSAQKSRTSQQWVTILVRDEGHGIEPDLLKKVWEPFYTTREKGSGLGLFVVRQIVTSLGGHVEIASRPGQGTIVEVKLPVAEAANESPAG